MAGWALEPMKISIVFSGLKLLWDWGTLSSDDENLEMKLDQYLPWKIFKY